MVVFQNISIMLLFYFYYSFYHNFRKHSYNHNHIYFLPMPLSFTPLKTMAGLFMGLISLFSSIRFTRILVYNYAVLHIK